MIRRRPRAHSRSIDWSACAAALRVDMATATFTVERTAWNIALAALKARKALGRT